MLTDDHIDTILGPERNPRQGFGAADILAWMERRRERHAARPDTLARLGAARQPSKSTGLDEFFARVPRSGDRP